MLPRAATDTVDPARPARDSHILIGRRLVAPAEWDRLGVWPATPSVTDDVKSAVCDAAAVHDAIAACGLEARPARDAIGVALAA